MYLFKNSVSFCSVWVSSDSDQSAAHCESQKRSKTTVEHRGTSCVWTHCTFYICNKQCNARLECAPWWSLFLPHNCTVPSVFQLVQERDLHEPNVWQVQRFEEDQEVPDVASSAQTSLVLSQRRRAKTHKPWVDVRLRVVPLSRSLRRTSEGLLRSGTFCVWTQL